MAMRASEDGASPHLTSNQKGAIAEAEIASAAVRLGVDIYRPMVEGGRFDLVFGIGPKLLRVQCKWAARLGDVVSVRVHSSRRITGGGHRRRSYTANEVDAVVAYCPENQHCYVLPISLIDGRRQVYLRLAPTKNHQCRLVHWAEQYELSGAIAQLGER